jgi:hypothetical protein
VLPNSLVLDDDPHAERIVLVLSDVEPDPTTIREHVRRAFVAAGQDVERVDAELESSSLRMRSLLIRKARQP